MHANRDHAAALNAHLHPLLRGLTRAANRVVDSVPLTATQREILLELYDFSPLRLRTLAEHIGATSPTTSRAIEGLIDAKLATRERDHHDRRVVLHGITPKGKKLVDRRRAIAHNELNAALGRLSPTERDTLIALTAKLNDELQAIQRSAAA